jgi:hypothetical protein
MLADLDVIAIQDFVICDEQWADLCALCVFSG